MQRWKNRPEGSNWGDFGPDDQRGKMNLLTPEIRRAAAQEIVTGEAFCLSLPLDYPGGSELIKTRKPPKLFSVSREGRRNYHYEYRLLTGEASHTDVTCDDAVILYTQYSTQWDALAHYGSFFDADGDGRAEKVYYNGYRADIDLVAPATDDDSPKAKALGIENMATAGVQGRGVLVDLHAVHGRARHAVGYEELMNILRTQGAEVRKGDFLCLYTGYADMVLEMKGEPDAAALHAACPGLDGHDPQLLQWISDSGIVAICADNIAVEVRGKSRPRHAPGPRPYIPLHQHCLFKQGIHLGELWYFTELNAWLTAHSRRAFFLTAPPLRLPGSVGSPATPVATV